VHSKSAARQPAERRSVVPDHARPFEVGAGEQVGLAGLGGSGKEEIAEAIAGLVKPKSGEVLVAGASLKFGHVPTAQKLGVSYVPRDRRGRGIVPQLSVAENLTLTVQRTLGRYTGDSVFARDFFAVEGQGFDLLDA